MRSSNFYKPKELTPKKQWLITILLLIVMVLTRSDYMPNLQDASWAVFFLVGFYLRSYIGLAIIILFAVIIDFSMIAAQGGHQDYYLAPSYLFIIPAYAALWFAGRLTANIYCENIKGLFIFIALSSLGAIACDLISSGGFFWLSSEVLDLSFSEMIERRLDFMPVYLKTIGIYLGIASIIHISFIFILKNIKAKTSLS